VIHDLRKVSKDYEALADTKKEVEEKMHTIKEYISNKEQE